MNLKKTLDLTWNAVSLYWCWKCCFVFVSIKWLHKLLKLCACCQSSEEFLSAEWEKWLTEHSNQSALEVLKRLWIVPVIPASPDTFIVFQDLWWFLFFSWFNWFEWLAHLNLRNSLRIKRGKKHATKTSIFSLKVEMKV